MQKQKKSVYTGLLLVLFLVSSKINSQTPSFSLTANSSIITLNLANTTAKNIMVVASKNSAAAEPGDFGTYYADPTYGGGSACGSGFVVYRGSGNTVSVSGTETSQDYYFSVYECFSNGSFANVTSQMYTPLTFDNNNSTQKASGIAAPVTCPALAGITCTMNGTSNAGYSAGTAPCNTSPFTGANPWTGTAGTGFISWSFSAPVKVVTVRQTAVNTNDYGTMSVSGGTAGVLTISSPNCIGQSGLVVGPYTGPGFYGDVGFTASSTGNFTVLNMANTGAQSGWIAACPVAISVLPIELLSFGGKCSHVKVVDLEWKTMTETNNSHFVIERSRDANTWEEIGRVSGAGNSDKLITYVFNDQKPMRGTNYYRLKQVDFGGTFEYSPLASVENCTSETNEVSFYPNPSKGIIVAYADAETVVIEIRNMLGLVVGVHELHFGDNILDISGYTNGTYFSRVVSSGAPGKMTKFVVQN